LLVLWLVFGPRRSMPHQDRDGRVLKDMARGAAKDELPEARAAKATHDEEVRAVGCDLREQLGAGITARAGLDLLDVRLDAVARERRADLCAGDLAGHLWFRRLLDGKDRHLSRLLQQ